MPLNAKQMPVLGAANIGVGAIGASQLAANAVTSAALAAGAVNTAALGANAVTAAKVAAGTVGNRFEEPLTTSTTTASGQPMTTVGITYTPAGQAAGTDVIGFLINGVDDVIVGDAVKTQDIYLSADAGVTARALAAVVAGDVPYAGSKAGSVCASLTAGTDTVRAVYSRSIS